MDRVMNSHYHDRLAGSVTSCKDQSQVNELMYYATAVDLRPSDGIVIGWLKLDQQWTDKVREAGQQLMNEFSEYYAPDIEYVDDLGLLYKVRNLT